MLTAILGALPLLEKIPSAVKEIAHVFGWSEVEKGAEVVEKAAKVLSSGQATPEQVEKLMEIKMKYNAQIMELIKDMTESEMDYRKTEVHELEETKRTELKSEDAYVRRTRPSLLRKNFYLVAFLVIIFPFLQIYCKKNGIIIDWSMYKELTYYTIFLFGVNYTSYTSMRSMFDKTGKTNPINALMGMLKR